MEERWAEVDGFPLYAVSTWGEIMNLHTKKLLRPSENQQGVVKINLKKGGRLYTKAVAPIVADAFIPQISQYYNSLINKDGDRRNNYAINLARRPRWFVMKYHRQFHDPGFRFRPRPFKVAGTDETFENFVDPCVKYGLLYLDVIQSLMSREPVFPTRQRFTREEM